MRKILVGITVFALVVVASGCGPSQAQIAYVKKIQDQVKKLTEAFQGAVAKQSAGVNAAAFTDVANQAKTAREDLEKSEAPNDTDKLRSDAVDLFQLLEQVSTRMAASLEYAGLLQAATSELKVDVSGASRNRTKFIRATRDAEKRVRSIHNRLTKLTPPPSFKSFHASYLGLLDDLADALHDAGVAVQRRDSRALDAAVRDLRKVERGATALKTPDTAQIVGDVISPADAKKLEELAQGVDTESNKILNK